jgi:flagellum-specific peptidoglycan hydrolase FlgJ
MRKAMRLVVLNMLFLLVVSNCPALAQDDNWGCYNPKPGHPTKQERSAFVERLKPISEEVSKTYGVPAAGILSMAIVESGFGWTRTAISANNLYGWKYGKSAKDAELRSWRLECQPDSDPGKDYAVFASFEDSVRFVAKQLSEMARYRDATRKAKEQAQQKVPVEKLVMDWFKAIQQAGYNPNPSYPTQLFAAGKQAGLFEPTAFSSVSSSGQAIHASERVSR